MANVYKAVGKMLKPVKTTLGDIKDQLNGIETTLEDLTQRIEEIEKILKKEA